MADRFDRDTFGRHVNAWSSAVGTCKVLIELGVKRLLLVVCHIAVAA
jgi:hypothetical protein